MSDFSVADNAEKLKYNGSDITNLVISDNITSIGNFAFYQNSLTTVTIGSNVSIYDNSSMGTNPGFKTFYYNGGKEAGTYFYASETWKSVH